MKEGKRRNIYLVENQNAIRGEIWKYFIVQARTQKEAIKKTADYCNSLMSEDEQGTFAPYTLKQFEATKINKLFENYDNEYGVYEIH